MLSFSVLCTLDKQLAKVFSSIFYRFIRLSFELTKLGGNDCFGLLQQTLIGSAKATQLLMPLYLQSFYSAYSEFFWVDHSHQLFDTCQRLIHAVLQLSSANISTSVVKNLTKNTEIG